MSTLIYKSTIQTPRGSVTLDITDTAPDNNTPSTPQRGQIEAPLELTMGDRARTEDGFPLSMGSYFDLKIEDPKYVIESLFLSVFDDDRFEVTLTFPKIGTWNGFVKNTLQQRNASRATQKGFTTITCFDGLGSLKADDTRINARSITVREFLVRAFEEANPKLPIIFYTDLKGETVEGKTVGAEKWRPLSETPKAYKSPTPNGPSGASEEIGLTGSTLRQQLNSLCETLVAVAYQDIKQEAWVVMDVAAIGSSVSADRYDGSSWSSYQMPQQSKTITNRTKSDLSRDQSSFVVQRSVRAACTKTKNWAVDPAFSHDNGNARSYFWTHTNTGINSNGHLARASSGDGFAEQTVSLENVDIYDSIDAIRVTFTAQSGTFAKFTITYGNGDTYTVGYNGTDRYAVKDYNGGHDSIKNIKIELQIQDGSTSVIKDVKLNFLNKLTDNPIGRSSDGSDNKWEVLETLCYKSKEKGRVDVEASAGGLLTLTQSRITSDDEVPAREWDSKRYNTGPYDRLDEWRAENLINLRPPPYEGLRNEAIDAWIPLGTSVKLEKPGENTKTVFVQQQSRTLKIGSELPTTEIKDVEIPSKVIGLLP